MAFSPAAWAQVTLVANSVTETGANLTISQGGAWHYKQTAPNEGSCATSTNQQTVSLSGLEPDTSYTYEAFNDANCTSPNIADETFTTVDFALVGKTATTATLKLDHGPTDWWYNETHQNVKNCTDGPSGEFNVTGLTKETDYTFQAYRSSSCSSSDWIGVVHMKTPPPATLTAGPVRGNSATLTLANHYGPWYYKETSPNTGTCTAVSSGQTASLSDLTAGQAYTYEAYSDQSCTANKLADETFTTYAFTFVSKTNTSATLKLEPVPSGGKWWYKGTSTPSAVACTEASAAEITVSELTKNTSYSIQAYLAQDCASSDSIGVVHLKTLPQHALFADSVAQTTATLRLTNANVAWRYQRTTPADTTCHSVAFGTTTVALASLSPSTTYTYESYRTSCTEDTKIDHITFTTKPAAPGKPTATVAGATSVTLSWTPDSSGGSVIDKWQYIKKEGNGNWETNWADMSGSTATTTSHTVTGLSPGTAYKFKVRAKNTASGGGEGGASAESDSVTTLSYSLTTGSVTHNTASLTINNWSGNWHYKANAAPHASCSSTAVTGTTKSLSGLSGNTSYTYKAYSDSSCNNLLATASSFLTKPAKPGKPAATAGAGSGKLTLTATLSGGSGALTKWEYTKDGTNWTDITTDTDNNLSHLVTGLTDGTNYTFKVRATNATGTGPASEASTAVSPLDETLASSNVQHDSATLTIGNYPGSWHYKHTTPSNGTCSTAVSTTAATVSDLTANTSYTFAAYSDTECSDLLATAAAFPTLPPKPAKPTATQTGNGELTLASSVGGGSAAITGWEYKKKKGSGNYDASWTEISSTAKTLSQRVTGLTAGSNYQFKVRAVNGSGESAESDPSDAVAAANKPSQAGKLTLSSYGNGSVTLTWAAPADGGSAITDYDYQYRNHTDGGFWTEFDADNTSTETTKTITGLTNGKEYRFRVRAGNAIGDSDKWSYPLLRHTVGVPALVAAPTLTLVDSSGTVKVAWAAPSNNGSAITGYSVWHREGQGTWTEVENVAASATSHNLSLSTGKTYTIGVEAHNAHGGSNPRFNSFTGNTASIATASGSLAAGSATTSGMTLTLSGSWPQAWHYKYTVPTGGACSTQAVPAGTSSKAVTGLDANTSYTFKAYSDSTCAGVVATASAYATLPPKPAKPTATAGSGSGKLTLASSIGGGNAALTHWEYKQKKGGNNYDDDWTEISSTSKTLSHTFTGLDDGTNYQFKVRAVNGSGDSAESNPSDAVAPLDEALAVSSIEHASATLTLNNWSGDWYYKHTTPSTGSCVGTAVSTPSTNVTGLTGNTSYIFKAYSNSGCSTELTAASSFLTKPAKPIKPTVTANVGSGKLKLVSSITGGSGALTRWEYATNGGNTWKNIAVTDNNLSAIVGSLTNGTGYTFKVRARNATGHGPASDASDSATPAAISLAASSVEDDTATLTISNWSGAWRYKRTTPSNGSCSSEIAAGTSTADLTGLSTGTRHIYKAYSDSTCTGTAIATASAFTTKPGKVGSVAAATQNAGLKVTWSAETGATSYKVQWKSENDNDWDSTNRQTTASGTSKTLTSLENGGEYSVRVRATNATGDGDWSDTATGTPSTKPPAPNKPTVAARHEVVILGWTSGGNGGSAITKWKYLKKVGANWDSTWTEVPNSGAGTTSYTVPNLTNGTAHRFKVLAVNANGDGAASPESDAATPGSVTLSVKSVTATKVTLEITGHNTNWSYKGQQAGATCSGSIAANSTPEVTTLTKATAYNYDAYATTDCTGAVLATVSFVTTDVPAKPTNLTVAKGNAKVTLRWTSGSNGGSPITKWQFKKHDGSAWDSSWTDICTTQNDSNCPSKTSHDVSSLTNGTAYKFKVQAVNVNGGTESSESTAVTPSTKPGQPTGLTATKGDKSVALSWTSGGDGGAQITKWQYRRKISSWASWQNLCVTANDGNCPSATAGTASGLTNGTAYTFQVRAVNGNGNGTASAESASVTPSTTPPAPTNLIATKGYKSVSLRWATGGNGGSPITGWKYLQHENGNWSAAQPMTGSDKGTRSYVVSGLSNGTAYKFKVLAVNANGDGAESAESTEATPSDPVVSAENVTTSAATITLTGYSGAWSHKPQSGGSCTAVNSGNSSRVTGLNSSTAYNYSVYVGTDCTGDSLGGVSFTTKDSSNTGSDDSDDDPPTGTVDFTPGLRAVPMFLSASDPLRQSFVRVINTGSAGTARIFAFDDTGQRYGPVTLSLRSGGARHFNSTDLELGKPEKGLPEGIGGGMGDWRLLFDSDQPLEVLSYVRGRDGFVTSMHEVAPADDDGIHSIHFLNPASNWRQESRLRLVNWEATSAVVEIRGWDDAGEAGDATVVIALDAREVRTLTAQELEAAGLGNGDGKWRLEVAPRGEGRITAMSLLESPTGHLSNLSAANGTTVLPLFLSAADAPDRQGFARIINHTSDPVTARLSASDDSSWTYEPVSLALAALGAAQFNSQDFEHGNPDKGLSAGVGTGQGHWRIRVTGSIGLLPLAYSRAGDGFVTGLNGPAPMTAEGSGESHRVAFFNPGSNWRQVSLLWLANPGERTADVRIAATDDLGRRHGSSVALRLPPGGTRMLRSDNLEAGDEGFEGAFGDGVGKWRLDVRSTQPITVMSLLESPTDYRHLSNLSTVPSKALILPTRYAQPN